MSIRSNCDNCPSNPRLIVPLSDNGTQFEIVEKDQRIKELEDALRFTTNALSNFFPFCGKDVSKLPTNLDATQYQTCSYDGDKKLLEKFIECRKLVTVEEE